MFDSLNKYIEYCIRAYKTPLWFEQALKQSHDREYVGILSNIPAILCKFGIFLIESYKAMNNWRQWLIEGNEWLKAIDNNERQFM